MALRATSTNTKETVLQDHPIEIALFNSTRWITFVWLVMRVWLGWQWTQAGWAKLQNAKWMDGTSITGFWQGAIKNSQGDHPSVAFGWYANFLQGLVDNHSGTWFGPLIAYAEFLGGLAIIVGLFTGVAAFGLALMNFNFMLAGSAGVNPLYFLFAALLLMAWKNAGWWGLDRWVLPFLGTPWRAGSLFKGGKLEPAPQGPNAPPGS